MHKRHLKRKTIYRQHIEYTDLNGKNFVFIVVQRMFLASLRKMHISLVESNGNKSTFKTYIS